MLTKTSNNKVNTTVAVAHMNSIQKQTSPIIAKDWIFSDAPSQWSSDLDSYAAWVDSRSADRSGGSIQETDGGTRDARRTAHAWTPTKELGRKQCCRHAKSFYDDPELLIVIQFFNTVYTSTLYLSDRRSMKRMVAVYTITRTRTCISPGYG